MTTNDGDDHLGGRLLLAEPDALSEEQRSLYEHLESNQIPWATRTGFQSTTSGGRLIGPFNPMLFSPGVGIGLLAFMEAEAASTSLDEQTRQVVILVVGAVWQAGYELYAHSAEARAVGLGDDVIEALVAGEIPDALSEAERAAARVAHQLTAERRIDNATYAAARDAFGERWLLDLVLLVGFYQTVCGLLNAFEIPVPNTSR
ncbi:MAG TPA: carboxymuconolactone decarboxylase family protein [Gaiellaceae bacterium]|nr:carboxymuconolactone decarboxylase family protein [Gaiellaceae bacterium]